MATWLERLQTALDGYPSEARLWKAAEGELLVSGHAARLLACRLPGVEGNLFWHSPDLETPDKARPCLAGGGGFGGDRLWIAPEAGFIFTDVRKARRDPVLHSRLPAAMDPAAWRIVEDAPGHLQFQTQMNLLDHRTGKTISLRAHRQFDLLERLESLPRRIKAVSFAIRNQITCLQADPGAVAGAWDLLQLPPTGWLICPTVTPVPAPRSYYDPFGPRHVKCDRARPAVRFLIDGRRRIKMGLTAAQSTGRMGYYRRLGRVSSLIVRIFGPLPGEPYVDVPLASNAFFGGDAVQAYNDDGTFGGFGEMEYHDPAVVAGRDPAARSGASVTHVLVGPDAEIRKVGAELLGVKVA